MQLGKAVRRYREMKRMTQDELAERSGISQGYISKLERSRPVKITFDALLALSDALGMSVITLIKAATNPEETKQIDARSLVALLKESGFTPSEIEQVTLYLHALKPEAVPLRWAWEEGA